jgi:hypothetical protein
MVKDGVDPVLEQAGRSVEVEVGLRELAHPPA